MNINGQEKGVKHIYYIRDLTNEIWCKENDSLSGRKMDWNECLRKALRLHIGGLIRNRNNELDVNPRRCWW